MATTTINPPQTPIVGTMPCNPEWWRWFYSINRVSAQFTEGAISTPPGSGLEGGGLVANGVSLSIASNGVTNPMLRQSLGNSVMGRAFGSDGNVADIQAVTDRTVLSRVMGQLVFTPAPEVDSLTTTDLKLTGTPSSSTATVTHTIPVECGGVTYYLLLSNAP